MPDRAVIYRLIALGLSIGGFALYHLNRAFDLSQVFSAPEKNPAAIERYGGTKYLLKVRPNPQSTSNGGKIDMGHSLKSMTERLKLLGVSGFSVGANSTADHLSIAIPNSAQPGWPSPNNDPAILTRPGIVGLHLAHGDYAEFEAADSEQRKKLEAGEIDLPRFQRLLPLTRSPEQMMLVPSMPDIEDRQIESASFSESDGDWVIELEMTEAGTRKLEKLSGESAQLPLVVVLDDEVFATLAFTEKIDDGKLTLRGDFSEEEVSDFVALVSSPIYDLLEILSEKKGSPPAAVRELAECHQPRGG